PLRAANDGSAHAARHRAFSSEVETGLCRPEPASVGADRFALRQTVAGAAGCRIRLPADMPGWHRRVFWLTICRHDASPTFSDPATAHMDRGVGPGDSKDGGTAATDTISFGGDPAHGARAVAGHAAAGR